MLSIHQSSNPAEGFLKLSPNTTTPVFKTEYFTVFKNEKAVGRAAAIINPELTFKNLKTGLLGLYECEDDDEAAEILLKAVEDFFKKQGFQYLIGPMDGSTWHKYRFAVSEGEEFFLDVRNPAHYPQQFLKGGFEAISRYYSSRSATHKSESSRVQNFLERFKSRGIAIRSFDVNNFEAEIRAIYKISTASFKSNFLYTPISFEEMSAMYAPLKNIIDPRFVLIAENAEKRPLAFIFALQDILSKDAKKLIIKTVAAIPESEARGLGTLLVEMIHERAAEHGFTEIIHALMHESNTSMNIAPGDIFRRYVLFGKSL
jgi:L-amino acid N-acyltransferase YncA